jgi:toxin ParE1/3/4
MPTVIRTSRAIEDLKEIVAFIAYDDLAAACNWLTEIESLFELLSTQPSMGIQLKSRQYGKIRRFARGNYLVYFRAIGSGVEILRVLHGARDHRGLI